MSGVFVSAGCVRGTYQLTHFVSAFSTNLWSLAKGANAPSQVNLMEGRSDKYVRA